jgi:hypothetical protein
MVGKVAEAQHNAPPPVGHEIVQQMAEKGTPRDGGQLPRRVARHAAHA